MKPIQTTAIVGMGALGLLFGEEIQRHLGREALCFVADADRVARYRTTEFTVNGAPQHFAVVESAQAAPVDLVIVAVKYNALPAALEVMAPCVGPDTTIISLLNGISSEEIIAQRYGEQRVIYTVAQGMDAVKFGGNLTYTHPGALHVGLTEGVTTERLDALLDFFTRAGVPYVLEPDIMHRLWAKFMLNVGINQCCMAYETTYGGALADPEIAATFDAAMREVQALAACEGVTIKDEERAAFVEMMRSFAPNGMPSMRQDGIAKRPSEVEMFSGTVLRLAAKHGLPTPVNQMLYTRIKAMEAAY